MHPSTASHTSQSVLNAANKECSRVESLTDFRRSLCIFPAAEKTRSTPAEEQGAEKYCFTGSQVGQKVPVRVCEANIGVYFGLLLLRNHYQGMAPSGPNPLEIYPGDLTRSVRMVGRVWGGGAQDPNLNRTVALWSLG